MTKCLPPVRREISSRAGCCPRPVLVGRVEHEAAHLRDAHRAQLARRAPRRLPVRRPRLDVDRGVRVPREDVHPVAEQPEPVVAAAPRVAVDRAERVGLVRDHDPALPECAPEPAVPGARASVLGRATGGVSGPAPVRHRAHHREDRHRALASRGDDQPPHLLAEVWPREAADPQRLRLPGDLPDERGPAALAPVAVHAPLVPRGRVVVDEQANAGERVPGGLSGGGRRSACQRRGAGEQEQQNDERDTSPSHRGQVRESDRR